jgi:CDP-diglyceride synthetase
MGEHGGFFAGSMFGSTRIVPHLSPNKSLEGFIGNMAASSLISLALRRFFVDALPIPSDHYWVRARGQFSTWLCSSAAL